MVPVLLHLKPKIKFISFSGKAGGGKEGGGDPGEDGEEPETVIDPCHSSSREWRCINSHVIDNQS
jgi:hypothetical protein